MKKFFEDFKAFIMKGNVLDMAVGVIIGGAFSKIVSSLVADIITPLISLLTPQGALSGLSVTLREAVSEEVPALTLNYGMFIQNIIDFLIIALSIFTVLRIMMNAQKRLEALRKKKEEEAPAEAPAETELDILKDIRAALKKEQ